MPDSDFTYLAFEESRRIQIRDITEPKTRGFSVVSLCLGAVSGKLEEIGQVDKSRVGQVSITNHTTEQQKQVMGFLPWQRLNFICWLRAPMFLMGSRAYVG